jgi:crotonobetainyl-CoA:carnitine CoA-transferase CaiB-like acyl-CoA transferase
VIKIGESPPEPFGEGERPLSGIRVLDLTRVLAGPTCARTLAEHGADVLRIAAAHLPSFEALVMDTGHGKRSAHLDLRDEQDASRMRELMREGDIFSQAYRPGALDRLGFSAEALAALRPGIVYVSLSAFGHEGPWRDRRGWDSLVQNVSGIVAEHAVDGQPRLMPAQPIDYLTGYLGAFGALLALARRARDGGSYLVRVSLAQTGRWISERGRVEQAVAAAQPPDLPDDELAKLTMESETPFGRLRHLAPVVQLSETPARWERPAAPLGSSEPVWLS